MRALIIASLLRRGDTRRSADGAPDDCRLAPTDCRADCSARATADNYLLYGLTGYNDLPAIYSVLLHDPPARPPALWQEPLVAPDASGRFPVALASGVLAYPQADTALGLRTVGGFSGVLAEAMGWVPFYAMTVFASLPAMLIMVRLLRRFPELGGRGSTETTA